MKVTLRKANAIQNSIQDLLRDLTVETEVSLTEYVDADAVIAESKQKLTQTFKRRVNLTNAQYDIRKLIGTANNESGINEKLTVAALVDRHLAILAPMVAAKTAMTAEEIAARLDKIRKTENGHRQLYGESTVVTSLIDEGEKLAFAAQVKDFKKQKQKLNDEILELNIRTEIEFPEAVVNTLMEEGLI